MRPIAATLLISSSFFASASSTLAASDPLASVATLPSLVVDASVFDAPAEDALTIVSGSTEQDRAILVDVRGGALSGIDIHKEQQSGSYLRFLHPDGRPITQIGDGGQFETVAWVTISGVIAESGSNRIFVPPTNRPYMLGVWSDVNGPTAVLRSNTYTGATGESWPLSIISGAGRERLRIDDSGNLLFGDISGNVSPGETLQLRLGRKGDTGLLLQSNDPALEPARYLVQSGGWYGGLDSKGAEQRFLGLSNDALTVGNDVTSLVLRGSEIRLAGPMVLGAVDPGTAPAAPAGAIAFCSSCSDHGAIVYSNGQSWFSASSLDAGTSATIASAQSSADVANATLAQNAVKLGALAVEASSSAARASGAKAVALGAGASAQDNAATAIGSGAQATGYASAAIGTDSVASDRHALAVGSFARAKGEAALAVGRASSAIGIQALAMGPNSSAVGDRSAAVGAGAMALATNALAVGSGAKASFAGSTAVGAGATATAANQVSLGGAGSSVRIGDVAASTAAQTGPTYAVTVDNNGTLGRKEVVTTAALNQVTTRLVGALAVTDQQFADLGGRVDQLERRLQSLDDATRGGIAAAMALGGTMVVPDSTVSVSFNLATYRGEQGFSGSIAARLADRVYIAGGFAGSSAAGSTGGRVGLSIGL